MQTEKTPLIQKLILGVLTLILVCLLVLIAQNRQSLPVVMSQAAAPEPAAINPEVPVAQEAEPRSATQQPARTLPATTRPAQPQPAPAPVVAVPTTVESQQAHMQPETPVTLVNPVRPQPLDIAMQPHGPVMKAEICGRVRLEGNPPPEVPIRLSGDCERFHEGPVTTRHYVVRPEGGLANVLVYIKGEIPKRYHPRATTHPMVTASGCFYEPYVQGMYVEQKLTIQNLDRVLHNFHATSRLNKGFNLSLSFRGQKNQISFEKPEAFVRLKCDVHPWEFAYIGVVPHPFFSVTDTNGVFCLPAGLPHGEYALAAVHPKAGEAVQRIIVGEQPQAIELALSVRR